MDPHDVIDLYNTSSSSISTSSPQNTNFSQYSSGNQLNVSKMSTSSISSTSSRGDISIDATSTLNQEKDGMRRRGPNDFDIGEAIGDGSYSTVCLAHEKSPPNRTFAIKILDKKHIIKHKKVKYVNVEKQVLSILNGHPFVVRLYFTFQDEFSLYFVLSLCENGDLLNHIRNANGFDLNIARFYAAELIEAIEFLHSKQVIHRDLKPENILLDSKMHIKLTDFGTARILTKDEEIIKSGKSNSFVGTAEYVPPELLNDTPAPLYAMDIWACGCIIYQLIVGNPPFKASNEYQTFQKIIKGDYVIPEGMDKDAIDLIKGLLSPIDSRLGCHGSTADFKLIKSHAFFKGVEWGSLWDKQAPLLPSTLEIIASKRADLMEGDFVGRVTESFEMLGLPSVVSSGGMPSIKQTPPTPSSGGEFNGSDEMSGNGNVSSDRMERKSSPIRPSSRSPDKSSGEIRSNSRQELKKPESPRPESRRTSPSQRKRPMHIDLSGLTNSSPRQTPKEVQSPTIGSAYPLNTPVGSSRPGYFDIPMNIIPGGPLPSPGFHSGYLTPSMEYFPDIIQPLPPPKPIQLDRPTSQELKQMALLEQRRPGNPLNRFTPHLNKQEVIICYGLVKDKRTLGITLKPKNRMLVLTDTPRLLYMDEKGIICKESFTLSKQYGLKLIDVRNFVIKTPDGLILEFEEATGQAQAWIDKIKTSISKVEREREALALERPYRLN